MIKIPFSHLEKMVRQNIFLSSSIKDSIITDWVTFEETKQQKLYDLIVVAYITQLQAMKKALEANESFLQDLEMACQKADWNKLKVAEQQELRKSSAYSEDILEELNALD